MNNKYRYQFGVSNLIAHERVYL